MTAILHVGRRLTTGTRPVASSVLTLKLIFGSAAEAQAAAITPTKLKYNKSCCWMYDHDDGGLDFYTKLYPYFNSLAYTDGTGGEVRYRATGAINGHDGQGNELADGTNSGKYTWANLKTMVQAGFDFANHSDLHTDTNQALQTTTLQDLVKTRCAALGLNYVLRAGVVPADFGAYVQQFINVGFPRGSISSQGSNGGYPILPPYMENRTIAYSDLPASGHFVLRRSLIDLGNTPLDAEEAIIDELFTGTVGEPRIFRTFSHSDVVGVSEPLIDYVHNKPGDQVWVPTLREFAEYLETRTGTTITKVIDANTAIFTLDQSALAPEVRWRDLSFTVAGGTVISVSLTGGKAVRSAGNLLNVYNSDIVPVLRSSAAL